MNDREELDRFGTRSEYQHYLHVVSHSPLAVFVLRLIAAIGN